MASPSHLNNFTRAGCFPRPSPHASADCCPLERLHRSHFCPCHLRLACFCRFRQLVTSCKKRWSAHRLSFYCSSNRLASCSVSWCGGGGAATGNTSSVFSIEDGGKKKDKHTRLSLTILRTGVTTNINFLKYYYYVNRWLINICKPVAFLSYFTSLFSGCHGVPSRCAARP